MVHQDAPHNLRGDSEKMQSVLPLDVLLIDQPKICFVNQVCGLQRETRIFVSQVACRLAMQFVVDSSEELVLRFSVAVTPVAQHRGHTWRRGTHVGISRFRSGNFPLLVRQTSVCYCWKKGAVVETCDN